MDNKQPSLGKDPVAPASLQSLEQTPSTPGMVSSSMPELPKRPSRFRPKQLILVAVILLMVAGLALAALVLNGRNKQATQDADGLGSYRVVENPIAASNASFASDAPDRNVTINGDLFLNGRLKLSAEANTDLTDILGRKVSLVPALNGVQQAGNISITGTVLANNFQGNGANLSNLNASAVTSGTLSIDRLDPSVTRLGQTIPLTALQSTVLSTLNGIGGNTDRNVDIIGSGNIVVTTDADSNQIVLSSLAGGGDITGVIAGTGLTGGGLVGDVTLNIDTGTVTVQGNTFNGVDQLVKLNGAGELPVISATNLTNLNASNVTTGSLSDTRLSANVTLQGNTFNLANKLVKLDGSGNLPALNGSAVTNLNAGNISTGTVADARLSANVALLNATQTFSGNVTFSQPLSVNVIQPSSTMIIGATNQSLTLQGDMSTALVANDGANSVSLGFTGTPTGDIVYTLDASTTPGNYTLCTTVGNCANAGGGVTTLGGTTNKLTKFTGGQSIGDSSITDAGTLVTVASNGLFKASADSTTAFRVQKAATSANVFTVDTTNSRVAIGQNTANYPLDVAGDINSSTGLRVGGNLVCDSSGCAASNGSGFYIQNGTNVQTAANLNIESASTTSPTIALKAKSGQTSNLFEASNSSGSPVATIDTAGNVNTVGQFKVNGAQIASSNLSNDANLAKLNGTQTFTGTDTFKNASDSTAGFQVQNASGAGVIVADTSNKRVAIGQDTAGYTLDVNGDVNITGGSSYRINGVAICGPLATCAPSSGSSSYVQNGLVKQTANFNVQSSNASAIGGIVQGAVGQTADVFQARNSNDDVIAKITASGAIYQGANQVCDASNNCGYVTSAAGAGNYIQNGTGSQTANMNIKSVSASSVTSNIQGASGQTANILQVTDGTTQGNSIVSVNQTTPNLIENSSFETNLSGWTSSGSTTNTQVTNEAYSGNASLQMNSTAVSSKAIFSYPLASSTQYSFSFYAKSATSSNAQMGVAYDGVTENNCGSIVITAVWTRYTCTFTTTTTSGTPNVYLKQVSTGARILYIDAVQLELSPSATAYSRGQISINGAITSPVALQNTYNSAAAFQIMNAAGSNLLNFNTVTPTLTIGSTNATLAFGSGPTITGAVGAALNVTAGHGTNFTTGGNGYRVATFTGSSVQNDDIINIRNGAASSSDILSVSQNNNNLITNPSFEYDTSGWAAFGSATLTQITSDKYSGIGAMSVTTTATANDGAKYPFALVAGTTYSFSYYARATGSNNSSIQLGYSADTTSNTTCNGAATMNTNGWTRFTCNFTPSTVSGTAGARYVYLKQTDAVARTFYIDAAQLETSSSSTAYSLGNISLNGTVTSPVALKNQSDSTNALQLQNAAGTTQLTFDSTGNGALNIYNSVNRALTISNNKISNNANVLQLEATGGNTVEVVNSGGSASFPAFRVSGSAGAAVQAQIKGAATAQTEDIFQVQGGNTTNNVLAVGQNNSNLVPNPSFDSSTTGWAAIGSANGVRTTADQYSGTGSMLITTTATANDGMRTGSITVAASTTYTLSFYARTASSFSTMEYGTIASSVFTPCQTAQTIGTTWTRYSCTFTSAASTSAQIFVRQTDAAIHTFYVDAFQLELGSTATNYSLGNIGLNGTVNSPTIFQNQSNSMNAFQIQNAAGEQLLNVDTNSTNLITNSSFEINTAGWVGKNAATIARNTTQRYNGNASLALTTTTAVADAASFPYALLPSTTYSLSFNFKRLGNQGLAAGYSIDGTTDTYCLNNGNTTITHWTRQTCTFTTGASVTGSPYIFIKGYQPGAAETIYIDAVQLEVAAAASPYQQSAYSLNGVITSAVSLRNQSDSTTALAIQNAAGTPQFAFNTATGTLCAGASCNTTNGGNSVQLVAGSGLKLEGASPGFFPGSFLRSGDGATLSVSTDGSGETFGLNTSASNIARIQGNSSTINRTGLTVVGAAGQAADVMQVQGGNTSSSILSVAQNNSNLISNPSFDTATTGWAITAGGASLSRITTDQYSGAGSMRNTNTATANTGGRFNYQLVANSTYTFSMYAKAEGSNFATFEMGYNTDGTTYTSCLTAQTVTTATWTRYTCTFTMPSSVSSTRFVYFRQTDATARSFLIDAVQLEATSVATNYSLGKIGLNGVINSPTIFQNQSDSSNAFQIQNAASDRILSVDTATTNLLANSSFESALTGWSAKGSATLTRSSTQKMYGDSSLGITYTSTSGDGATLAYPLASSTTYTLSMYVYVTSIGQYGGLIYSNDGVTPTVCTNITSIINTWARATCTFTTGTVSGTPYIGFAKNYTGAGTAYIDGVQLEAGSNSNPYRIGGISLNGVISSQATFKNQENSTTGFQVQNASGGTVLVADTVNNRVCIPSCQLGATGQTIDSTGINFTSVANNTTKISQTNAGLTFGQGSGNYGGVIFNGAANYASPIINVQSGQNSSSIVSVSQNNANLITNPSFDTDTTGWANFTGATLSRIITDQYSGQSSLSVVNTATAGAGAKINYNLAASTTYSFSLYAKATGSNFATFQIGYSADGATNTSCLTAQTVTTTGWTRYTCTFTTTTVSGTRYVYFAQTDGTARTFYVDAVQLEAAAAPTNYNVGNISLNGTITSPTTFQNQSNSNNAFTVQNTAGTNILAVDTVNNTVKATSVLGAQNNQLNLGSTGTQQQFNVGSISQFGTVNFMDTSQNNQVLTVNSTSTGVNLIGLGSNFSTGTAGFGTDGAAAITRSTVDQYSGAGSLRVVTSAAANDGVKLTSAWVTGGIANSTTYTLSVYAKASGSNFSTFQMGYTNDGTTYISCLTGQTVTTTAWQRYTCTFTTSASSPGRFIYFRQTDATARTFYIDAVQLEAGSVATGYSEGTITANGIFNSPAVFKNGSDSTTAFQVQNAAGTNLLNADTANNRISIGSGLGGSSPSLVVSDAARIQNVTVGGTDGNSTLRGASGSGGLINLQNTAAQSFSFTSIANTTASNVFQFNATPNSTAENLLQLQRSGTAVATVGSAGAVVLKNSTDSTAAFSVQNLSSVSVFQVDTSNSRVGVGNATPGNLLSVGALTLADSTAQLAVSTGSLGNKGIVIQSVAGQTADFLQAQDSTGAVLAKIDKDGNLAVKSVTLTGHIISGGTTPGIAAGPAAGTSPSLSITGTDTAGTITLTTGTSPAAGAVAVTVNFASNFASAPVVVFSPTNPGASSLSGASAVYVTPGTSSFTLSTWSGGLTASTLYQWSYHVIQ